jgi:hypothetical protein
MELWSQLARIGAAAAALSPAIAEADDDPEQVEMPTLDTNNQPVAVASIDASALDPDANLIEDTMAGPSPYIAAVPTAIPVPTIPEGRTPGPGRARPKGGTKPDAHSLPHARSWHGGGQRYGG